MIKIVLVVVIAMIVLAGTGAVFIWTGTYNIAAAEPHSALVQWMFATVRDRSIVARAPSLEIPDLNDSPRIEAGLRSYHAMCMPCHSAPGRQPTTVQQGLNPEPPKLDSERVQKRRNEELYWIIKNGIRMTGMPDFGKTHKDEALWPIIAFVRQLPRLHGKDYDAMIKAAGLSDEGESDHQNH